MLVWPCDLCGSDNVRSGGRRRYVGRAVGLLRKPGKYQVSFLAGETVCEVQMSAKMIQSMVYPVSSPNGKFSTQPGD